MATYLELAALLKNTDFSTRVRFAGYVHAAFILQQQNSSAQARAFAERILFSNLQRLKWEEILLRVVLDPTVRNLGAGATDAELQAAYEAVVADFVRQEVKA